MRRHWRRIISWHPVQLCHFPTTGREVGELRPQWGRSSGDSSVLRIVAHWATILRATFFLEQLLSQWDRGLLDPFRILWPSGPKLSVPQLCLQWRQSQRFSNHPGAENNCGPVGHNYELRAHRARSSSDRITSRPLVEKFRHTFFSIMIPHWGIISAAFNFLSNGEEVCAFSF